jgi:hypothetical protein
MSPVQMTQPPISSNAMADLLCTIMILCRGRSMQGKPCWAYMCIKPSMAHAFKEAREKGPFDLSNYGAIIESGDGIDPPQEVQQRMERDYGMNHNFEEELLRAAEAAKRNSAF